MLSAGIFWRTAPSVLVKSPKIPLSAFGESVKQRNLHTTMNHLNWCLVLVNNPAHVHPSALLRVTCFSFSGFSWSNRCLHVRSIDPLRFCLLCLDFQLGLENVVVNFLEMVTVNVGKEFEFLVDSYIFFILHIKLSSYFSYDCCSAKYCHCAYNF